MSPLAPPPADLAGFPTYTLSFIRPLYRVHRRGTNPWFFSSDLSGRFDLQRPDGTCYAAEEPDGAFVEVFGRMQLVDESDVRARTLSRVVVPSIDRPLADCTQARALEFGVTGTIHASETYGITQEWARAFRHAGFAGVRYLASHDASMSRVSIALFGPSGEQPYPVEETVDLPSDLVEQASSRFGIRVLPAPTGTG